MHARGERASALRLALSPLARFVRFYVLKLGFLDGVAGLRAHRDRRVRELPQVREAARASTRRGGMTPRTRHDRGARPGDRRGRLHRHAHRRARCSMRAPRSSASTISTRTTTSRSRKRALAQLAGASAFRLRALDLADAARRARCLRAAASTRSCTSPRSRACAIRSINPARVPAQQPRRVRPRARRLPARARSRTSSTRRLARSTARTTCCRSPRTSASTIRSASTRRPRRPTS